MTIEMTSDEIVNLLLGLNVEVLELVHSSEFLDVETVGEDTIWSSAFNPSTRGDGRPKAMEE